MPKLAPTSPHHSHQPPSPPTPRLHARSFDPSSGLHVPQVASLWPKTKGHEKKKGMLSALPVTIKQHGRFFMASHLRSSKNIHSPASVG